MITSEEACAKDLELGLVQREGGDIGRKERQHGINGKTKDPSAT